MIDNGEYHEVYINKCRACVSVFFVYMCVIESLVLCLGEVEAVQIGLKVREAYEMFCMKASV